MSRQGLAEYDPETPGQGFQMTVFPLTKKMFVTWVTYDTVRPGKSACRSKKGNKIDSDEYSEGTTGKKDVIETLRMSISSIKALFHETDGY